MTADTTSSKRRVLGINIIIRRIIIIIFIIILKLIRHPGQHHSSGAVLNNTGVCMLINQLNLHLARSSQCQAVFNDA